MDASDLIRTLPKKPCEEGAVHIWEAAIRSSRLNDASAPKHRKCPNQCVTSSRNSIYPGTLHHFAGTVQNLGVRLEGNRI